MQMDKMQIEGQPLESKNDQNSHLKRSFIKGEHHESCQNDLLQLNINIRNHLMELKSIKRNLGNKLEDNPENRLRDIKEQLESRIEYMEEIYEARINEAYKAMQEQKLLYERKIESLQKALTENESSLQMMRSNITLLNQNISEYEKVNQNLEIKVKTLTANANNCANIASQQEAKNMKNPVSETVLEKIKELQNRLQKLKEDKDSGTQIIESQKITIKNLELQNSELKMDVQKISLELEEAKSKSNQNSGSNEEVEAEGNEVHEVIDPLKERLDQYYAEIHKLNDEAMELKKENAELRQLMKEQRSQRESGLDDKSMTMEEEKPTEDTINEEFQGEENLQGVLKKESQFNKWKFYQEMMTKFQETDRLKENHQNEISKVTNENESLKSELKEMKEKYEQALSKNQEPEKPSKSRKNTKKLAKNTPLQEFNLASQIDFKLAEGRSVPVLSQVEKSYDEDHEDENKDDQNDSILRGWKEKQATKRAQKPREDGQKKLFEVTICTNCTFLIRKNELSINCPSCQGFIHQKCVRDIDRVGDSLSCQPCFVKLAMKKQEEEFRIDDIKEES